MREREQKDFGPVSAFYTTLARAALASLWLYLLVQLSLR